MRKITVALVLWALPLTAIIANQDKFAEKYLAECSNSRPGACEFNLGLIYHEGLGALQNDEKAIYYYKKAANAGRPEAAYNLSVLYQNKRANVYSNSHSRLYPSDENKKQYSDYAINDYAWLKVAMALGIETYSSGDEKDLPIERLFSAKKLMLSSDNLLQKGDKRAVEICSWIKYCEQ